MNEQMKFGLVRILVSCATVDLRDRGIIDDADVTFGRLTGRPVSDQLDWLQHIVLRYNTPLVDIAYKRICNRINLDADFDFLDAGVRVTQRSLDLRTSSRIDELTENALPDIFASLFNPVKVKQ